MGENLKSLEKDNDRLRDQIKDFEIFKEKRLPRSQHRQLHVLNYQMIKKSSFWAMAMTS